jgi:sulfide:quinone oxidoreductase
VTSRAPQQDPFRVVIAGGGVAALEALIALRQLAEERVTIELLSAEPQFWYRPLAVAEPFDRRELHGLDLSTVAGEHGAVLVLGELASVDPEASVARTTAGGELEYDALLVAVGARPTEAVPGALTFRGPADAGAIRSLLEEIESKRVRRVAFALPGTVVWPLPLYELALQTAATGAEVVVVTNEEAPLELFGQAASRQISELLDSLGVELVSSSYPVSFHDGQLVLAPDGEVAADRVVTLPRLVGPRLEGLPHDLNGFIPTDRDGRVVGAFDVFAAGDATTFPIKQGGLATQQADAAAESIAALAGAPLEPKPFRPVLRGVILTGRQPLFVRTALTTAAERPVASGDALWWPPAKIAGRYLAPYLAERADSILTPPNGPSGIAVDVALPAV